MNKDAALKSLYRMREVFNSQFPEGKDMPKPLSTLFETLENGETPTKEQCSSAVQTLKNLSTSAEKKRDQAEASLKSMGESPANNNHSDNPKVRKLSITYWRNYWAFKE